MPLHAAGVGRVSRDATGGVYQQTLKAKLRGMVALAFVYHASGTTPPGAYHATLLKLRLVEGEFTIVI